MSSTAQVISDNTNGLRSLSYRLGSLADAFGRTGNERVAEDLFQIAQSIEEMSQQIHDAYDEQRNAETMQSIKNGERFVGSILKSLLDGKPPKDACLEAMPHHFDRDLIDGQSKTPSP